MKILFVFTILTIISGQVFSKETTEVNASVEQILAATSVVVNWPKIEGKPLLSRNATQVQDISFAPEAYQVKNANDACQAIGFKRVTSYKTQIVTPPANLQGFVIYTLNGSFISLSVKEAAEVTTDSPGPGIIKKYGQSYEVFKQLRCHR